MKQIRTWPALSGKTDNTLRVIESTHLLPTPRPLPPSSNSHMDTKRFNKTYKKIRHIYLDMVIFKIENPSLNICIQMSCVKRHLVVPKRGSGTYGIASSILVTME